MASDTLKAMMRRTVQSMPRRLVVPALCIALASVGCENTRHPYLGPPGSTETHVVVEVRRGVATAEVWRLRSRVTLDDSTSQRLLPESAPTRAIAFPATYKILAGDRTGQVAVVVDALDQEGRTVGRALGAVNLVAGQGVNLPLDLGLPCDDAPDCDDGVFCNGRESCVNRTCAPGERACPPSIHACVEIGCSEESRGCLTTAHHDRCAPAHVDGGASGSLYCDVALGCLAGRPGAPAVAGDAVVQPTLGRLGTVFRVTFHVTEPLAADPVVRVDVGTRRVEMLVDDSRTRRPDLFYVYAHTADGSEQEGRRLVSVDLVDLAGDAVTGLSAGSFTLDFTPPSVVGQPALDAAVLKAGAVSHLDLTLSEVTQGAPALRMGLLGTRPGDATLAWTGEAQGTRHTFTFQAQGTEPQGVNTLWLQAADPAGNQRPWTAVGSLVLDFTAPRVDGVATVLPPLASVGRTVVVDLSLTEPVACVPTLSAVSTDAFIEFSRGDNTGQRLTFYHLVEEGQDGVYDLRLEGLEDLAGNGGLPEVVGHVTFDGTGPLLLGYTQNLATLTAPDVLRVGFHSDESLGVDPVVRLGSLDMARSGTTTSPYAYQLPMAGTDLVGRFVITVGLTDVVGNTRLVEAGSVTVDAVPPRLVDAFFTPPVARLGITAYLSLTTTEVLEAPPALGWDPAAGNPGFDFVARSGFTYTYALMVEEGATPGVYLLREVDLADPAGNHVVACPQDLGLVLDFTVDNVPPRITDVATNHGRYSAQEGHRLFVLTLNCSEPVDDGTASLAVTLASIAVPCGPYQSAPPNYTCEREVTGQEPQGLALIGVVATDMAGNVGVGNAAVELDFRAPTLVSSSARPALAKRGDTLFYSLTASEPLAGPPTLTVSGAGGVLFEHQEGTEYIYSYVVRDGTANGSHGVTVDLVDTVDNRASGLPGAGFQVDGTAPLLTDVATDRKRYSAQPGFNTITLTFDVDDPPATVSALVDASPMECGEYQPSSPRVTCTAGVDGHPGDDGSRSVSLVVSDTAGNTASAVIPVEYDFTPPAVALGTTAVQLTPPSSSLVRQVSRATHGTTVRVFFASTETLAHPPSVFVTEEPSRAFTPAGGAGSFYIFDLPLGAETMQDGPRQVTVELTDGVANQASVPLTGAADFEVDTTPPPSLTASQVDQLEYVRIPWGAARSQGEISYYLEEAAVPGLLPGDTLVVWDRPNTLNALEIGRGTVDGTGLLRRVTLNTSDRTAIYASVVDGAGNADGLTATLLRRFTWVATLGGKVAGSGAENPHQVLTRRWLQRLNQTALADQGASEPDATKVALPDDDGIRVRPALDRWNRLYGIDPPAGGNVDMALDTARGVIVVVSDGAEGDVLEYAQGRWSRVTPNDPETDGSPQLGNHRVVYDQFRNRIVLFGGAAGTATWEWNGASWRKMVLSDPEGDGGPSGRRWHGLAYDSARHKVMLYGGETKQGHPYEYNDELWEYDGNSWRKHVPDPAEPWPGPNWGAMVYDWHRERIIMLAGGVSYQWDETTWEWDGAGWERVVTSTPSFQRDEKMAYDSVRRRVVVHGGVDAIDSVVLRTWEYDTTTRTWVRVYSGNFATFDWPNHRIAHGMTYDEDQGRTVLFGGSSRESFQSGETWTWDGVAWSKLLPLDPEGDLSPAGGLVSLSAVYDTARERAVVVYEVSVGMGTGVATWEWDGHSWRKVTPVDLVGDRNPENCNSISLCYDDVSHLTVFLAGTTSTTPLTWTWDGQEWTCRCGCSPTDNRCKTADGLPGARSSPAMVWDPVRQVVLMYGGSTTDTNLWQWDNVTWSVVIPSTSERPPPTTRNARMVHDAAWDVVLLVAYDEPQRRVWEWVPLDMTWRGITPGDSEGDGNPTMARDHPLFYDATRGRAFLATGFKRLASAPGDNWEWDGQEWLDLGTVNNKGISGATTRAWTTPAGDHFIYDGTVWQRQRGTNARSALTAHFDLASAGMPGQSVVEEVWFTTRAGARGTVGHEAVPGVSVLTWSAEGWREQVSDLFAPDTMGEVSYGTVVPADVHRFTVENRLHLAVAPSGTHGAQGADLVVDYVELVLRYRLP
jgi:hypothetical protein